MMLQIEKIRMIILSISPDSVVSIVYNGLTLVIENEILSPAPISMVVQNLAADPWIG
jgi:hypothetical protein